MGHLSYQSGPPDPVDAGRTVAPQRTSKGLKLQILIAGVLCVPLVVVLVANVGLVLGGDPITTERLHLVEACAAGLVVCFAWLSVVKLVAWWRYG